MELKGKLIVIGEIENISNSFKKRQLVIETEGDYPQTIAVEIQQDKVDSIEKFNFKVGSNVLAKLNLRGRKWTSPQGEDKYFNTIVCWYLDHLKEELTGEEKEVKKESISDLPF